MTQLNLDAEKLQKLQKLTATNCYEFLGFTFNLEKSILTENLAQPANILNEWAIQIFTTLLSHYSLANPIAPTGNLVKFKDIPGGYAYEDAFTKRAIEPIADVFGENPQELLRAANCLGGTKKNFGDASAEISALKGISLTYILWGKEEFPASANILYDASARCYLPTEDLTVLGEVTTLRLTQASKAKIN